MPVPPPKAANRLGTDDQAGATPQLPSAPLPTAATLLSSGPPIPPLTGKEVSNVASLPAPTAGTSSGGAVAAPRMQLPLAAREGVGMMPPLAAMTKPVPGTGAVADAQPPQLRPLPPDSLPINPPSGGGRGRRPIPPSLRTTVQPPRSRSHERSPTVASSSADGSSRSSSSSSSSSSTGRGAAASTDESEHTNRDGETSPVLSDPSSPDNLGRDSDGESEEILVAPQLSSLSGKANSMAMPTKLPSAAASDSAGGMLPQVSAGASMRVPLAAQMPLPSLRV